jgi:hypothetical protein
MKRLDQGHLHPLLEHLLGRQSNPGRRVTSHHSSKELFEQLLLFPFGTSTVYTSILLMFLG